MAVDLDRRQVLAHRTAAQGLHGVPGLDLDVLAVGLQDTPAGSAALGLRHRADRPPGHPDLVLALTVRGSPHLHRRADLPVLRAALRPHDNEMLRAYLGGHGDRLVESGADGPALLVRVADELRASFPGETATKGELSESVTPRLPEIARPWCERCGTAHVADGLFRLATLYAGAELVPGEGRGQRFRLAEPPPTPHEDDDATTRLLSEYVRLAGPVTPTDLATWLDTRPVTAPPAWLRPIWTELAGNLVQVTVDGRTLHAHPEMLAAMADAPAPPPALLLPPRDAYLLGHRAFLAPDRTLAKEIWRAVGSPGALLLNGEVAGVWRARQQGRTLRLTITTPEKVTPKQRSAIDEQAEVVAAARAHNGRTEVGWEG